MKYLIPALLAVGSLLVPGEALAHRRHHHGPVPIRSQLRLVCGNNGCVFGTGYRPVRHGHHSRRVRIDENCVYKPYKNKFVCKY